MRMRSNAVVAVAFADKSYDYIKMVQKQLTHALHASDVYLERKIGHCCTLRVSHPSPSIDNRRNPRRIWENRWNGFASMLWHTLATHYESTCTCLCSFELRMQRATSTGALFRLTESTIAFASRQHRMHFCLFMCVGKRFHNVPTIDTINDDWVCIGSLTLRHSISIRLSLVSVSPQFDHLLRCERVTLQVHCCDDDKIIDICNVGK